MKEKMLIHSYGILLGTGDNTALDAPTNLIGEDQKETLVI